jgi:macrodomain Ter protein organizer (MatP/YcbG family)
MEIYTRVSFGQIKGWKDMERNKKDRVSNANIQETNKKSIKVISVVWK